MAYCVIRRCGFPVSSGGGSVHCSVIEVSLNPATDGDSKSDEIAKKNKVHNVSYIKGMVPPDPSFKDVMHFFSKS